MIYLLNKDFSYSGTISLDPSTLEEIIIRDNNIKKWDISINRKLPVESFSFSNTLEYS
jgi:hypothetical protein